MKQKIETVSVKIGLRIFIIEVLWVLKTQILDTQYLVDVTKLSMVVSFRNQLPSKTRGVLQGHSSNHWGLVSSAKPRKPPLDLVSSGAFQFLLTRVLTDFEFVFATQV